jgi:hypothetical protein
VEEVEEPAQLSFYNCPACTLENPINVDICSICGTPKPANAGMMQADNEDGGQDIDHGESNIIKMHEQLEKDEAFTIENRFKLISNDIKEWISLQETVEKAQEEVPLRPTTQETDSKIEDDEDMGIAQLYEVPEEPEEQEEEDNKAPSERRLDDSDSKNEDPEGEEEDKQPDIFEIKETETFYGPLINDNNETHRIYAIYLRSKLLDDQDQLKPEVKEILNTIFEQIQKDEKQYLPNDTNYILESVFGQEFVQSKSVAFEKFEEFEEKFVQIILADPILAWKYLECQGYDL